MENIREQIVMKVSELDMGSHTELYNFIKQYDTSFTQNNNGMFIDLNNINTENLIEIHEKVDQLIIESNEACFIFENDDTYIDPDLSEISPLQEVLSKCENEKSPLIDKESEIDAIKHFDQLSNKLNKKNAHNKFSVIKKKYNKQMVMDHLHKKLDDTHLNELCLEEYILHSKNTYVHSY
tara:strand:- start:381 stop:920 length:540 start_codon:yes stop_codon:yes gene_type:complete